MAMTRRFEFDNYKITVERLPEEEQPERTSFYDKTDFYGCYIFPVYLHFSEYAKKNGLKPKYNGQLNYVVAGVFYYKLDYELRKIFLHKRGYACGWFFNWGSYEMGKFSDKFIRVLQHGKIIAWNDVTKLARSKKFINSVIRECRTLLVAK